LADSEWLECSLYATV